MTIREYIKAHSSEDRDTIIAGCMKALKVRRRCVLAKLCKLGFKTQAADAAATQAKARTLADFRKEYDKAFIIPTRIRAGLKALGKDGWDYEVNFARLAGVSLQDLGTYREQFADHVVPLKRDGRRAWAGSTATAQAMKEMLS